MNKIILTVIILIIAIVLIGFGVWVWQSQKGIQPAAPKAGAPVVKEDSTASINDALNRVDINNLDKEFQEIDADLNSL